MTDRELDAQIAERKPCISCGYRQSDILREDDVDIELWYVECGNIECMATGPRQDTRDQAIAAWNRVAALAQENALLSIDRSNFRYQRDVAHAQAEEFSRELIAAKERVMWAEDARNRAQGEVSVLLAEVKCLRAELDQRLPDNKYQDSMASFGYCEDCDHWRVIPVVEGAPQPPLVQGQEVGMCVMTLRVGPHLSAPETLAQPLTHPRPDEAFMATTARFGCIQFKERTDDETA